MMKVAFFLGALNRGGTESLILDVCRNCHKTPFEVVCLYRNEGTYSEEYHQTDATLVQIERKKGLLRYLLAIRSFVQRGCIDIIHAQTPSNAILCIFALAFTKTKLVTTFHGIFTSKHAKRQLQFITTLSDKVCCVSEYEKKYYVEQMRLRPVSKLCTVYNGVNFDKLTVREQSVNKDGIIRLCTVGNFVPGRSPWIIAKALRLLKDRGINNFEFSFIGRRSDTEEWRYDQCVEICKGMDNVYFLGARNDVPALLQSMDGFVYSTENDTFGIAVVEAIAVGLPAVVNDWEVMKEITHNGGWATLFKTDDAEDCANKIQDLIEHLAERKAQAMVIAQEVREEYSIEKHIQRLYEIYQQI